MAEKRQTKTFARKFVPKIIKATILVIVTYLPLYFLSTFMEPFQSFIPWYGSTTDIFVAVFAIFLVIGVFTSGTIYPYIFGAARSLLTMIFFIYTLNGGIINLALPMYACNVMVDLTVILAMLVLVCLLGIGKNIIQAIGFVSAKVEADDRYSV